MGPINNAAISTSPIVKESIFASLLRVMSMIVYVIA
jgi:hypothetical protein